MHQKICPYCRQLKPYSAFCIDRSRRDGRDYRCRLCRSRTRPDVGRSVKPTRANPLVACACGCGASFPQFNNRGEQIRFVRGHNMKVNPHG